MAVKAVEPSSLDASELARPCCWRDCRLAGSLPLAPTPHARKPPLSESMRGAAFPSTPFLVRVAGAAGLVRCPRCALPLNIKSCSCVGCEGRLQAPCQGAAGSGQLAVRLAAVEAVAVEAVEPRRSRQFGEAWLAGVLLPTYCAQGWQFASGKLSLSPRLDVARRSLLSRRVRVGARGVRGQVVEMLGPRRRDAGSGLALPALRPTATTTAQAACAVGPGRHRPHRPTTSSRCCPASTTGHLAHRAGLREPASSRRPLTTRLPPTSRCGQQPRRPRRPQLYHDAGSICRRTTRLLHAVAPSAAARPRGSPCSWAAVVEALGCAVLPQAQPTYRRPRLCRRASPSARLSCAVQPPCRPRRIHDAQQAQQSRRAGRAPAYSPTPTRQPTWRAQLGYAVASASSRSQRCIGEPAARRVSRRLTTVTGGPTSAGRAHQPSGPDSPSLLSAPRLPQRSDQQEPTSAAVPSPTRLAGSSRQRHHAPAAQPRRAASSCRGICPQLSLYFDHHGA